MSSVHDHIPEQSGTFLPVLVTRPGEKGASVSYWVKNGIYFRMKPRYYLHRLKIIGSPDCPCRHGIQTVGRLMFQCKRLKNEREILKSSIINTYPTAFPYGNGMVLHFYQQQESSTTKTVHKVINKGLKTYV